MKISPDSLHDAHGLLFFVKLTDELSTVVWAAAEQSNRCKSFLLWREKQKCVYVLILQKTIWKRESKTKGQESPVYWSGCWWEEEAEQQQSLACIKVLLKISFAFQKEEDPWFGFWLSAPEKFIGSLKDVTVIVKAVLLDLWIGPSSGRSERSKEGQGGQWKTHPQESLIMAPVSELQVLLLFVYVLTSVFCPNEAESSFFFFANCKTPLDFCQARSTSSAI